MASRSEAFRAAGHRAITLLGMSGVGKTTLADKLPRQHWFHYSGDYRIGTKYLEEPILDNIKRQAMQVGFLRDLLRSDSIYIRSNITFGNLQPISSFLGKVGDPARGGLAVAEFKRRQALHREAEIGAMNDVGEFIHKAWDIYGYRHFINDAGGSICELDDDRVLERLAELTLIVYLEADEDMQRALIARQLEAPKPLYYAPAFFDQQLEAYLAEHRLGGPDEMDPDDFVQWTFPRLVAYRRPLYAGIAERYGVTVSARDAEKVQGEADFIDLLAEAM